MRAGAFGPAAVTRLACATRAPFATPWRRRRRRTGQHRRDRDQALSRRATKQGQAGIEPARPWQALRGELPRGAIQHNGLLHARPSFRSQAHSRRACAQPPLCLAPTPRLRGASARGTEPMPRQCRSSCAPGVPAAQVTGSGAASGAVMELAPPAHHPPPEGAPWLSPLSLLSVAPCSPRQGQALRAREYARP